MIMTITPNPNPEATLLTVVLVVCVMCASMLILNLISFFTVKKAVEKPSFSYEEFKKNQFYHDDQQRRFMQMKKELTQSLNNKYTSNKAPTYSNNIIEFKAPKNNIVSLQEYKSKKGRS